MNIRDDRSTRPFLNALKLMFGVRMMSTRSCGLARLLGVSLIVSCACAPAVNPPAGIVITNARVIDGSGGPSRNTNVRIEGERIGAVDGI